MDVREKRLEDAIEDYLITKGGYIKGGDNSFDRALALETHTLFTFIENTQPKEWERYQVVYGSESHKAFITTFCKEVKQRGLINVFRVGFKDRGISFRVVYFKPENGINEDTTRLYNENILTCVRQLHYSVKNENSLDMALFVNGIPIVTLELKNQFTGQSVENGKKQYMYDRNPNEPIFEFRNRALVHFVVDISEVYMTTKLMGAATRFLPFNQGSGGAGNIGRAGNPNIEDDYDTSYLWKNVLNKDILLEILNKYIHLEVKEEKDKDGRNVKKEKIIFPRYHQLDVVSKLLNDVKENGSGKNYLIQHSAGSGKSNSIAWLAHRLSGLHNASDEKIFNSVIVITDRKVLDSQLQDTIYQFDHKLGVVEKIDKKSAQLKDAINSGKAIIITTLQKFPVIYKEVTGTNKNFAVIVDEAHSSQTGEAAKKLKIALADTKDILEEYARMEGKAEAEFVDDEDKMLNELATHGLQKNLSFFAFTATPKAKTLQMFGERQPDGKYQAFHIYSMRQAIEEGFILDVLQNYTTYNMYYKIAKSIAEDPELDASQGVKAITKFESLHPHNLAQKTAIIVEQFREVTKKKIGGKAKAMVVTGSRLHAVRYLFEFRRYIKEKGYKDLDVLVAFSGTVDDDGNDWTEEKINKDNIGNTIKESQLKEYFKTDDFNMLIVAEKYQTGFDEPLLHTMFVDKKLYDVKAVQTLSRINRMCDGKEDTFVLDFVNSAEDIKKSFEPFYDATILGEETNPNVIYTLKNGLNDFKIYQQTEIDGFVNVFYSGSESASNVGKLTTFLKPAVDRYKAKTDAERNEFKSTLGTFIRTYSFVTQICRMFDTELQRFFVYAKLLNKLLPKDNRETLMLDNELLLEYYRLEKDFEGSIELGENEEGVKPISGGIGGKKEKRDPLSIILEKINEKFGTSFGDQDKVMMQMQEDLVQDETLASFAKNNDEATFKFIFEQRFKDIAVQRYEKNEEFFVKMFNDENFMSYMMTLMRPEVYRKARKKERVGM